MLEFNARFGDPETQVYLTRLENDSSNSSPPALTAPSPGSSCSWNPMPSVCVVMASAGYPGKYDKGKPIHGLDAAARLPNTKVFHAGTVRSGDQVFTNGGRVLGVTAWAKDLKSARDAAYAAVDSIRFEGAHFRRDIAAKALA